MRFRVVVVSEVGPHPIPFVSGRWFRLEGGRLQAGAAFHGAASTGQTL